MDISTMGPLFYLTFALPGFVGVWALRTAFNVRGDLNGWQWTCCSVLYGIVVLGVWELLEKNNVQQINGLLSNPIAATIFLSLFAFMFSFFLRGIVFLLKYIGLGILAVFAITYSFVSDFIEGRKKRK